MPISRKCKHPWRNLPIKDSMGIIKREPSMHSPGIFSAAPEGMMFCLSCWPPWAILHGFFLGLMLLRSSIWFKIIISSLFSHCTGKDGREGSKPLFLLLCASNFHISWVATAMSSVILEAYCTLCLDLDMGARDIQLSLPPCDFPTKRFHCSTGFLLTFFLWQMSNPL